MRFTDRLDSPKANAVLLLIAIAVASALLINAVVGAEWAKNLYHQRMESTATAARLALALSSHSRALAAQGTAFGASSRLREAVASADPVRLQLAAAETAALIPAAHSVQIVPLPTLGIADPRFDPATLRNNLEVHQAGQAFKGAASNAEVFADDGKWLMTVAAPIPAGTPGQVAGILLIRIDLVALTNSIIRPDTSTGGYTLSARGARGGFTRFVELGPVGTPGDEYTADTGIGSLRAGFYPARRYTYSDAIVETSPVLLLILIIGAVLAVLTGFAARRALSQLIEDAAALTMLLSKRQGPENEPLKLHFAQLSVLAEALSQRRDAMTSSRRPREDSDATTTPAGTTDAHPMFHEPLEIEELAGGADGIGFVGDQPEPVPDELFRDYDIRGKSAMLEPLAYRIGVAIGSEALETGSQSLVIGADGRETSPALREQLVRGLLATGIDVIDIGMVATPMLYFACHHLKTMSGVMVTGSHNPADHNGFKVMLAGETLCGDRIKALRQRILEARFREGQGSYRVSEIDADYQKAVCDDVLVDAPLRVVIDCGNGAASVIAAELFQELGCEVFPLFCEVDGRFPNHPPDPAVPENLRHLRDEVSRQRADIGIAFDGDGDRIGVVTASGRIVGADRLLMLFAQEVLSRNPGADIVFDVKCSRDLSAIVTQHGGRPILCRSGHSWIKQKMKETGALLGGEFTGHICFGDRWFGFDDALYAAARLLEILTTESRSLDELLGELPQAVSTPEIHIAVPEDRKFALMAVLDAQLEFENARLLKLDGVRAEFPDGWGLVRASNTTAALVLRFEARDEAALARIENLFRAELARCLPSDIAAGF